MVRFKGVLMNAAVFCKLFRQARSLRRWLVMKPQDGPAPAASHGRLTEQSPTLSAKRVDTGRSVALTI